VLSINKFKTSIFLTRLCGGGTAATAFGCSPEIRGFESHPSLFNMVEIVKKINREMFDLIESGKKRFEVRIEDDCKFNEGDILVLKEHDGDRELTGREMRKKISFILRTKDCDWWDQNKIEEHGFTVLSLE
jgi:hypothetical protein